MAEFQNIPLWQIQPTLPAIDDDEKENTYIKVDKPGGAVEQIPYWEFVELIYDTGSLPMANMMTLILVNFEEDQLHLLFRPDDHHVYQALMDANQALSGDGINPVANVSVTILKNDLEIKQDTEGGTTTTISAITTQYKSYIESLEVQENQPE
jgi:hypothetical protein